MLAYNILSAMILVGLIGITAWPIWKFISKKTPREKIEYLRSFKKGKCAVIYVVAIPIYMMGLHATCADLGQSIFQAIGKAISLIALQYDFDALNYLMSQSLLFTIATYYCFFLVTVNAIIFFIAVLQQYIWCFCIKICWNKIRWKWKKMPRNRLLLIGNNPQNVMIFRSDKKRFKVIVDTLTPERATELFKEGIQYIHSPDPAKEISRLIGLVSQSALAPKDPNGKEEQDLHGVVVINTGNDETNLELCRYAFKCLNQMIQQDSEDKKKQKENIIKLLSHINIYVFGSPNYEALYRRITNEAYGCIHYVNKYRQIAIDFIDQYPLSLLIPKKYVNEDTTLPYDVKLNVTMLGFGKTNQHVFLTSVANNQFLTWDPEDKLMLKKVNYYVFDKEKTKNNKNLNHAYLRYENEFLPRANPHDYLPLPSKPADLNYSTCNINDPDLYTTLWSIYGEERSVNVAVIAFGSDLENIDLAEKLIGKMKEWKLSNLYVFVKVRSGQSEHAVFKNPHCILFGSEQDIVYDIERITKDKFSTMEKERNRFYALEKNAGKEPDEQVIGEADYKWYMERSQLERDSNTYCVMSLRSKFHLLGLDFTDKPGVGKAVSPKEFSRYYSDEAIKGTPEKEKLQDSFKYTRRGMLGIQEHYRWNSYMISQGIVPSSTDDIKNEKKADGSFSNGKNYALRKHGNITTVQGLVEFRRLVAARDNRDEMDADVIRYDFELMDNAVKTLERAGYTIIEKEDLIQENNGQSEDGGLPEVSNDRSVSVEATKTRENP